MKKQPTTVQLKTYAAETGLVYQYYFVGKRRALDAAATEFVFDVSSSPERRFSVSVFMPDRVLSGWGKSHGRPMADAEIYAAAKMKLLRAFDQIEDLFTDGRRLEVESGELEESLGQLGVE